MVDISYAKCLRHMVAALVTPFPMYDIEVPPRPIWKADTTCSTQIQHSWLLAYTLTWYMYLGRKEGTKNLNQGLIINECFYLEETGQKLTTQCLSPKFCTLRAPTRSEISIQTPVKYKDLLPTQDKKNSLQHSDSRWTRMLIYRICTWQWHA